MKEVKSLQLQLCPEGSVDSCLSYFSIAVSKQQLKEGFTVPQQQASLMSGWARHRGRSRKLAGHTFIPRRDAKRKREAG